MNLIVNFYLGKLKEERYAKYLHKLNSIPVSEELEIVVLTTGGSLDDYFNIKSRFNSNIRVIRIAGDLSPLEMKLYSYRYHELSESEISLLAEDDFEFSTNINEYLKINSRFKSLGISGKLQHSSRRLMKDKPSLEFPFNSVMDILDSNERIYRKCNKDIPEAITIREGLLDTRDGFVFNKSQDLLSYLTPDNLSKLELVIPNIQYHDDYLLTGLMMCTDMCIVKTDAVKHDLEKYLNNTDELSTEGSYTPDLYKSNTVISKKDLDLPWIQRVMNVLKSQTTIRNG